MFKAIYNFFCAPRPLLKRERLVGYANRRTGKVVMWPERIDPEYALGVYGLIRQPQLDEPKDVV